MMLHFMQSLKNYQQEAKTVVQKQISKVLIKEHVGSTQTNTERNVRRPAPRVEVDLAAQDFYLEYKVRHFHQQHNWDCGLACIVMVLSSVDRANFITNFHEICDEGGFKKMVWTIDLCYILKKYHIEHTFSTIRLGVFGGYRTQKFYGSTYSEDQERVNAKFEAAENDGLQVKCASLSTADLVEHLKLFGPIILLVNGRFLSCDICKSNRLNTELAGMLPLSNEYFGHYILLCGYNLRKNKFLYRNPTFADRLCALSFDQMEKARKSFGTDEDVILVYRKEFH